MSLYFKVWHPGCILKSDNIRVCSTGETLSCSAGQLEPLAAQLSRERTRDCVDFSAKNCRSLMLKLERNGQYCQLSQKLHQLCVAVKAGINDQTFPSPSWLFPAFHASQTVTYIFNDFISSRLMLLFMFFFPALFRFYLICLVYWRVLKYVVYRYLLWAFWWLMPQRAVGKIPFQGLLIPNIQPQPITAFHSVLLRLVYVAEVLRE